VLLLEALFIAAGTYSQHFDIARNLLDGLDEQTLERQIARSDAIIAALMETVHFFLFFLRIVTRVI
jgi:hypothetical protein